MSRGVGPQPLSALAAGAVLFTGWDSGAAPASNAIARGSPAGIRSSCRQSDCRAMNAFAVPALASRTDCCSAASRMADLLPIIETYEHRWMRAWLARDSKALKSLTARNFVMLIGSKPPVVLDAPSWLEAATTRYLCKSYRFSDVYVRNLG